MVNDDERREVARRLRGDPCDTLIPYRTGVHFGMGCHEAANRFWDMCERIKSAGDYDIAYSTRSVLADLIDPDTTKDTTKSQTISLSPSLCDRDALLALADEMDMDAGCHAYVDDYVVNDYARRIREALGVSGNEEGSG